MTGCAHCGGVRAKHQRRFCSSSCHYAHRSFDPASRFSYDVTPDGCWVWNKGLNDAGYGLTSNGKGKNKRAHVASYELVRGPVPAGLVLDHLCRNRACINPEHLEPVTRRENTLRGVGASAQNARKSHCPRGHAYDEGNTVLRRRGGRECRTCINLTARERRARKAVCV